MKLVQRFCPVFEQILEKFFPQSYDIPRVLRQTIPIDMDLDLLRRLPGLRRVMQRVEASAPTDIIIIVEGETGVGKDVVCNALHYLSKRAKAPFVAYNCAALPTSLQESTFFGHEKGAFTGAVSSVKGLFEQAQNGTLFLDEVEELNAEAQAMLLRVLDEHRIRRIGSTYSIPVDVRIIAATEAAFCSALRVTLVGSMIPRSTISTYSPFSAS